MTGLFKRILVIGEINIVSDFSNFRFGCLYFLNGINIQVDPIKSRIVNQFTCLIDYVSHSFLLLLVYGEPSNQGKRPLDF